MKKLAIALLVAAAAIPVVAKTKHKEKRFEPVAITRPAQAAGRYVGIDPDLVIELRGNGGTLRNFKRTATLANVVYDGSELRATAIFADGRREPLEATFGNQVKNGDATFGLLLRNMDVRIDADITIQNLFCRRQ
jgi:hypothetical protein